MFTKMSITKNFRNNYLKCRIYTIHVNYMFRTIWKEITLEGKKVLSTTAHFFPLYKKIVLFYKIKTLL